ncbi:MAG TPA: hypothetical protein PK020_15795 [Ilumatobacteraceae bacterium]|nr:hypothetical protein [Ilumatobacteraceae bacterium]HRB02794.1 hypothetical protein [Ilumatobacteraceae bacterium]
MHSSSITLRSAAALVAVFTLGSCGGSEDDGTAAVSTESEPTVTDDTVEPTSTSAAPTTTMSPTTTSTTPPAVPGEEWQQLDAPFEPSETVAVGDTLWIAGRVDDLPVLASSLDGSTWTTYDLVALGLPTQSTLNAAGSLIGQLSLGSWDGYLYALVAVPPQPGASVDDVAGDLWVVTTEGAADGVVRLIAPAESGLDQRLAGPENFRIMDLGNGIEGTPRPTFTAIGQWWQPYATSDADFAAIELGANGRWAITSEDTDDGWFESALGAQLDGNAIAISQTFASDQELVTWTRTEAGWQLGRVPLPAGINRGSVDSAASAPGRIVAVGAIATDSRSGDDRFVAWTTTDGVAWSVVELAEGTGAAYADISVAWTGQMFVAASSDGLVWSSTDGNAWAIIGDDSLRNLVGWAGRLVSVNYGLQVSPPLG